MQRTDESVICHRDEREQRCQLEARVGKQRFATARHSGAPLISSSAMTSNA